MIGAVAGSMSVEIEKSFLVVVIKILLSLCEVQRTKDSKAIIASCIMYVVRKYPRFLQKHWKFLQTVVRKLIEFLHEKHPGVQDMSIETLEEICLKCGDKFLSIQENDDRIFLEEILDIFHKDMLDNLEKEQIENLFHTWGVVIGKEKDNQKSVAYIDYLLQRANKRWEEIINEATNDTNILNEMTIVSEIIHLLKIFKQTNIAVGSSFLIQMSKLYMQILDLYSHYAAQVSSAIQQGKTNHKKKSFLVFFLVHVCLCCEMTKN